MLKYLIKKYKNISWFITYKKVEVFNVEENVKFLIMKIISKYILRMQPTKK